MWWIYLIVILLIIVFIAYVLLKIKRKRLMEKYMDKELVDRIMQGHIWLEQTEEQLKDSIGKPIAIDNKVMKTRHREVWKYDQTGKNRFALRITLDDGIVVAWDKK